MDIAQVHAAVVALYGPDPVASKAANTFLMDIAQQPVAWSVGMALLTAFPGDANANFFGAHMLYTKVTRHWHQLDAQERVQLSDAVLALVRGMGPQGAPPYAAVTMTKLCLVLAAVAVRTRGGPAVYVNQAFVLGQGAEEGEARHQRLRLMMHMLETLTDEADAADMSRALRLEIEEGLLEAAPHVLSAVEHALTVATGAAVWSPGQRAALMAPALKCLASWVELGISLSTVATRHAALYTLLLRTLAAMPHLPAPDGSGVDAGDPDDGLPVAREACAALQGLLLVAEYPRPSVLTAALESLLEALTRLPVAFQAALDHDDDDAASAMVQAAVDVAEKEVDLVAGPAASRSGLALVEFLLQVCACPSRKLAQLTLDFWISLQDSPVAERHPSMAHEVYTRLLDVLLRQSEYPQGFTTWKEHDCSGFDPDDFNSFRDDGDGIKDVLVVAFYLLRAEYLERVLTRLQAHAHAWQTVEACLLAVTHVAKEARAWVTSPSKTAEGAADAQRSRQLLQGLIRELVLNSAVSSNSLVLAAGCRLVGAFAPLLADSPAPAPQLSPANTPPHSPLPQRGAADANPLLAPALAYLCAGLRDGGGAPGSGGGARAPAAAALRAVCAACERAIVADPAAVEVLVPQLRVVESAPVEQQLEVAEAVTRVLAGLEPAHASRLLVTFAAPPLEALTRELNLPTVDLARVTCALQLLSQIIRFLDAPPSPATGAHAATELLSLVLPRVDAAAARCRASEDVMSQLFALVGKALSSLRTLPALQSHIPAFINVTLDVYVQHHYPCCLEAMATAVEVYSGGGAQAADHFGALFVHVCADTFTHFQGVPPSAKPQLVAAFFGLAYRYLLFAPAALINGPHLGTIMDLAAACLDPSGGGGSGAGGAEAQGVTLERDSARAVAIFAGQLAQRCGGKLDAYSPQIDAVLVDRGGVLCRLLLVALARAAPNMLWTNLIDCLHSLLHHYLKGPHKAACQAWVGAPVSDPSLTEALTPEDRHNVAQAICRLAVQNRPQFKALMLDFAKICHHEQTRDGLLAYFIITPATAAAEYGGGGGSGSAIRIE